MDTVNEGSTAYLTVTFLNKAGTPDAPNAVSYRVDDQSTGAEIKADTSIAAGSSVEIVLPPSVNAITGSARGAYRRVTVTGTYGADDAIREEFVYQIRQLRKVGS